MDPAGVEAALLDDPQSWLPGSRREANRARATTCSPRSGSARRIRVRRQVRVELGEPVRAATKTVVPLRWTAVGAAGLFPELDADLEIAPLAPGRCQLAMSARYVPPLGVMGRALDRAVLFARGGGHAQGLPRPRGGAARRGSRRRAHRRPASIGSMGRTPPLRIMLVDDHEIVRDGIKAMLDTQDDVVVTAQAGTVQEAIDEAAAHPSRRRRDGRAARRRQRHRGDPRDPCIAPRHPCADADLVRRRRGACSPRSWPERRATC